MLKEPLFHFLILGLLIYGGYAWLHRGDAPDEEQTIRVGPGELGWLRTSFQTRWQRGPTPAELQGLVDEYVRETVLYREALTMGLDQNDIIVRRRLAQKLEFLIEDLAEVSTPTDEELEAYFEAHRASYREPDRITFSHVFLDPDRRGEAALEDASEIRATLEAQADPTQGVSDFGDPFMLQSYYPERTEAEIAKLFGRDFGARIAELGQGRWHGPVLSGYGVHLVYVHEIQSFPQPTFGDFREQVKDDWTAAKRQELNDEYVTRLLEKYEVVIEEPAEGQIAVEGEASP